MQANKPLHGASVHRRQFLSATVQSVAGLAGIAALGSTSGHVRAEDKSPGREPAKVDNRRKVKIAAIALATVDGMMDNNYARALRMAEISLKDKPDIILLPEAFAAGYCGKPLAEYAEDPAESKHLARFCRLSREAGCMVILGYLEKVAGDRRVRNAVVIYDRGVTVGRHFKRELWPDARRPYRDELALMVAGERIDVFNTRLGRFAVLICYENGFSRNWEALRSQVDYVLSPYNSEGDPSNNNVANAKRFGIPSAWADRTGTVYCGDGYMMNPGTAGIVDACGKVVVRSQVGAEVIAVGEIDIRTPAPSHGRNSQESHEQDRDPRQHSRLDRP